MVTILRVGKRGSAVRGPEARATVQAYNEEGQSNGDEALPVGY